MLIAKMQRRMSAKFLYIVMFNVPLFTNGVALRPEVPAHQTEFHAQFIAPLSLRVT